MTFIAPLQNSKWGRGSSLRQGFTLLELVVVMTIMILLIGIGVLSFDALEPTPVEQPVTRLTQMSKLAHQAAVVRGQGMVITLEPKGFGLIGDSSELGGYYTLPEGVRMLVMPWGAKKWMEPEGTLWRFGPQGVSEPMSIRFEAEGGSRELVFHPLTGSPVETVQ